MAKNIRKSKRKFVITLLIFLAMTGAFAYIYFYIDNEITTLKTNKNYNSSLDYKSLVKIKTEELNKAQEEYAYFEKTEEQLSEVKNNYYKALKELEDKVANKEVNLKIAYLTFDDGPYYNTHKVLDILDEYDVKATFFTTSINGEKCYDNGKANCYELYQEYLKRGHTIANHTYTHGIFNGLYRSVDTFMDAVIKQEEHIKEKTGGYITNIVRFPGGSPTAGRLKSGIITELRNRGYGWVDWTANDGDGGNLKSTDQAWSNLKSSIDANIEVVLFHDYDKRTTAILPDVIKWLRSKNYILLPLFYESRMINK